MRSSGWRLTWRIGSGVILAVVCVVVVCSLIAEYAWYAHNELDTYDQRGAVLMSWPTTQRAKRREGTRPKRRDGAAMAGRIRKNVARDAPPVVPEPWWRTDMADSVSQATVPDRVEQPLVNQAVTGRAADSQINRPGTSKRVYPQGGVDTRMKSTRIEVTPITAERLHRRVELERDDAIWRPISRRAFDPDPAPVGDPASKIYRQGTVVSPSSTQLASELLDRRRYVARVPNTGTPKTGIGYRVPTWTGGGSGLAPMGTYGYQEYVRSVYEGTGMAAPQTLRPMRRPAAPSRLLP
ncbi:MAG: hypothetical protein CMJ18_14915 [Phycisphaeraceae bacterium]|nr:hypothetical protein [Phycisphaeraceae bacterium]